MPLSPEETAAPDLLAPPPAPAPAPAPEAAAPAAPVNKQLIGKAVAFASQRYGVDQGVLAGMVMKESALADDVIAGRRASTAGAQGIAQFMPDTAKKYGVDVTDPVSSIMGMAAYMRDNLTKFGGDYGKAIAGYNWGENHAALQTNDWQSSAPAETKDYVNFVSQFADQFNARLASAKPQDPGRGTINPPLVGQPQPTYPAASVAPSANASGVDANTGKPFDVGSTSDVDANTGRPFDGGQTTPTPQSPEIAAQNANLNLGAGQMFSDLKGSAMSTAATGASAAALYGSIDHRAAAQTMADFSLIDAGKQPTNTAAPILRPDGSPTTTLGNPNPIVQNYAMGDPQQRAQLRTSLMASMQRDKSFVASAIQAKDAFQQEALTQQGGQILNFSDIRTATGFANWAVRQGLASSTMMASTMLAAAVGGVPGLLVGEAVMAGGDIEESHIKFAQNAYDPSRYPSADRQADAASMQGDLTQNYLDKTAPATVGAMVPYAAGDLGLGPAARMARPVTDAAIDAAAQTGGQWIAHQAKEYALQGLEGAAAIGPFQEGSKIGSEIATGEHAPELTADDAARIADAAAGGFAVSAPMHTGNIAREQLHAQILNAQLKADADNGDIAAAVELANRTGQLGRVASKQISTFTEPGSPSEQAGLTPIAIALPDEKAAPISGTPQVAPQDSGAPDGLSSALAALVADGNSGGGNPPPGGVGTARPDAPLAGDAGGADTGAAGAVLGGEPGAGVEAPGAAGTAPAVDAPALTPAATWAGRSGTGYTTVADATQAIQGREARSPDLRWVAEQGDDGKWVLNGYRRSNDEPRPFSMGVTSLGVPREQMPQIQSEHHGALVNFLNARDISHTAEQVDPSTLKATQDTFIPAKVQAAEENQGNRSVLVSSDGYVLDGHHQWLADLAAGRPTNIIRLDSPIKQLLLQAREFPSATTTKETENGRTSVGTEDAAAAGSGQDVAGATGESAGLRGSDGLPVGIGGPDDARAIAASRSAALARLNGELTDEQIPGGDAGQERAVGGAAAADGRAGQGDGLADAGVALRAPPEIAAGSARTGVVSPELAAKTISIIEQSRGARREPLKLAQVQNGTDTSSTAAAKLGEVFGAPVMTVRATSGNAGFSAVHVNGVVVLRHGATLDAAVPLAMHEVLHSMDDDLKADLIEALRPYMNVEQHKIDFPGYSKQIREEEVAASLAQAHSRKPEFWHDLAAKIGDKKFGAIAKHILAKLGEIIGKFKGESLTRYAKDVEAVRDALTTAFAEHYARIEADRNSDAATHFADDIKANIEKATPDVVKVMKHLTPAERRMVTGQMGKKIIAQLKDMPSANEFAATAFAGKAKRGWYRQSAETISSVFGPDAPRFAALLAALSPQCSVETNLRNALNTWKNWVAAGRPQTRAGIMKVLGASVEGDNGEKSVLDAWVNNSLSALTHENPDQAELSGPKVNSFFRNLRGDVTEVTNDAWMSNFALVDQAILGGRTIMRKDKSTVGPAVTSPKYKVKGQGYLAMNARVREAAATLSKLTGETWTPAEVQETVWSWAKSLYELANKAGSPGTAQQIIKDGGLTDELINATPDFGSLFNDPRFAGILKGAGYGKQLENLRATDAGAPGNKAAQRPGAGRQAGPFAEDSQRRYELAAARRLDRLAANRGNLKAAARERQADDAVEEASHDAGSEADFADDISAAYARELQDAGSVRGGAESVALDSRPKQSDRGTSLDGLPAEVDVDGQVVRFGGFKPAQDAARAYMRSAGLTYAPPTQYVKVDPKRSTSIANAFEAMRHDPQDPQVKAAYAAMIKETIAQYKAIMKTGLKVEFIDGPDPYGNPRNAIIDVTTNNHLWVYPTTSGFGSDSIVNIGLATNDGKGITAAQAITMLKSKGVNVVSSNVHQSDSESTLVAWIDKPLSAADARDVSAQLGQEAIAQLENGKGELHGPEADKWKPFNGDYFLTLDGKRLPDFDPAESNPLLQKTDIKIGGKPTVANDIFRVVHDYFGHIKEGVGFRADGEENAWRSHAAMYSDEARAAMTTETRGQNSWVNFGPHGEANRTASGADTQYAPQKIGLLPESMSSEGRGEGVVQFADDASKELGKHDDLFKLPKSNETDIRKLLAETMPGASIYDRVDHGPGEWMWSIKMPNGRFFRMDVNDNAKFQGQGIYSNTFNPRTRQYTPNTERPGTNARSVEKGDVWIDVSNLEKGEDGQTAYNMAMTYAHNTGRVFIGDPAGVSDAAMRRRPEHMLSSALKFGTTEHLAPHPDQVAGRTVEQTEHGKGPAIPPLAWKYGDHAGNITRLIDHVLQMEENLPSNPNRDAYDYDLRSGQYTSRLDGSTFDSEGLGLRQAGNSAGAAPAAHTTMARRAVLRALRDRARQDGGAVRAEAGDVAGSHIGLRDSDAGPGHVFYADDGVRGVEDQDRGEPYSTAPDGLMGFRKSKPNKAFADQKYQHVEFVRVTWPDGRSMLEAQRGLNQAQAMERARRNWSDAEISRVPREIAAKEDPSLVSEVDEAMKPKVDYAFDLNSIKKPVPRLDLENGGTKETDGWLLSRDPMGNFRFGAGAKLYRAVANVANHVLDKVDLKPASPELKRAIRQMRSEIEDSTKKTAAVAKEMIKLSPEERELISDVIEHEVKAGATPSQKILETAAQISALMSRQTDDLIALGMLSKEAAEKWRDKYLPRFYEKHLPGRVNMKDEWAKAVALLSAKPRVLTGIGGKSLKRRGLTEVIDASDLKKYQAMGWALDDKGFVPGKTQQVQVARDFTPAEREKMGEIRDANFRFVMGYMRAQKDLALGRLYAHLAETMASRHELEGYVRVPDSPIEGTDQNSYGKLAGMWVPREVLSHLAQHNSSDSSDILRLYKKGLTMWKEGKTALNPVSHMNNVVSHLTNLHLAGVSYWEPHKYAKAALDFFNNTPMLQEAKAAGLFGGTMSDVDLQALLPKDMQVLAQMTKSTTEKTIDRAWNLVSFGLRRPMGEVYKHTDLYFRHVLYRDAREHGLHPNDAVEHALKYVFDYGDIPKTAKTIRDYAIPFFSYTYKVAPVLAHTALNYPWRYAAPWAILTAVNTAMYAIAHGHDDGDDDWKSALRKWFSSPEFRQHTTEKEASEHQDLPPWMKGRNAFGTRTVVRLGEDQLTNAPVFLNVARFVPGGDLLDMEGHAGGVPWLQNLTPSNPLLNSLYAMQLNKDPFLGKDVVNKDTDTSKEAALKRAAWLWQQFSPAIAVNGYIWNRSMNAIAQATGKTIPFWPQDYTGIGKDGLPIQPKYAAMQDVGIKAAPIDLDLSAKMAESEKKKIIMDLEHQIKSMKRLENKGAVSVDQAEDNIAQQRDKQQLLRQGLDVNGNEKE